MGGRTAGQPQPAPNRRTLEAAGIPRERAVLAARVGELRLNRSWTRQQLAAQSAVNPTVIGLIERGAKDPQLSTLLKLVQAFGLCSVDQLFGELPAEQVL